MAGNQGRTALIIVLLFLLIIPLVITSKISSDFAARHRKLVESFPNLSDYDIGFTNGMSYSIFIFWALQQILFTCVSWWSTGRKTDSGAPILRKRAWMIFLPLPLVLGSLAVAMFITVFAVHYRSSVRFVGEPRVEGSYIMNFTLHTYGRPDIERYFCGLQQLPHNYTLYEGRVVGSNAAINFNGTELRQLQRKCAVTVATRWMILPYMVSMLASVMFFALLARGIRKLEKLQRAELQYQEQQASRTSEPSDEVEVHVQRPKAAYWWDRSDHKPQASSYPEIWELKGWGFKAMMWPQPRINQHPVA